MAPHKLSSVDLPQPLRPTKPMNWPGSRVRETSLSAVTFEPSVL